MNIIETLDREQIAKLSATRQVPDFQPGDTLQVNVKVVEGERSRVQAYEGVCIARSGSGINENFTVRKISYGEGVERAETAEDKNARIEAKAAKKKAAKPAVAAAE